MNAGKLDISGFESEITIAPVRGLTLNANVGYTHIKYLQLPQDSPLLIPASCLGGPVTLDRCAAQPLARSPKFTMTLGANYSTSLGKGTATFSANYAFKDKQYSNNSTSNSILLPEYGIMNLRAEYDSGGIWKASVFGTNVFDKYYITTGTNGLGNVLGTYSQSPGEPAQWGASLTLKF